MAFIRLISSCVGSQLEDELLAILQTNHSGESHPLLTADMLKIKSSIDLHSAAIEKQEYSSEGQELEDVGLLDSVGTLTIRDDGAASFYGPTAGHESLLMVNYSARTFSSFESASNVTVGRTRKRFNTFS